LVFSTENLSVYISHVHVTKPQDLSLCRRTVATCSDRPQRVQWMGDPHGTLPEALYQSF